MEKLARDKCSSLLRLLINYVGKNLYNFDGRGQCYKTFFGSNLQIFALSYSVCKNRLEKLARDKRSSLLRILINYGGKKFYYLMAGANVIKLF